MSLEVGGGTTEGPLCGTIIHQRFLDFQEDIDVIIFHHKLDMMIETHTKRT